MCSWSRLWNRVLTEGLGKNSHRIYISLYPGQRRQWHPNPVLLPGKSHGWRSLVGCSPWGREESDMTERLLFHFSLLCIGEGNGNPIQCSCLENPRDGVTQIRTWLKWLSSSNIPRPELRMRRSWPELLLHLRQQYCL